jgi:pimeloyl-ACP methyl ester carboxylesterase
MSTIDTASAIPAPSAVRAQGRQPYVLVHGAWHGGWCWGKVAERLRAAGHRVFTPTMTGLGDRAHRIAPDVGLATYVEDVVATIDMEDLSDIVLKRRDRRRRGCSL